MSDQVSNTSPTDDDIDFLQLIDTFLDGKWLIIFFILITTSLAFIYAFGQQSIYQADALIQVEPTTAAVPGIEDLAGFGGDDTSVSAELELIKSRRILGQAVDELNLDIIAYPNKIPLLSHLHQRFFSPNENNKLPTIWSKFDELVAQYAWGNETIKISRLKVPKELLNKPLTLVLKPNKSYQLFFEDLLILKGNIGQAAETNKPSFSLFISEIKGLPETKYTLIKLSRLEAITNLQKNLQVSEKGKKTGIISLVLEGENKILIVKTLNHISKTYL
jgi:tyrosine-protein kinase Etk/Wzc